MNANLLTQLNYLLSQEPTPSVRKQIAVIQETIVFDGLSNKMRLDYCKEKNYEPIIDTNKFLAFLESYDLKNLTLEGSFVVEMKHECTLLTIIKDEYPSWLRRIERMLKLDKQYRIVITLNEVDE